jgi:head-tail adaptor
VSRFEYTRKINAGNFDKSLTLKQWVPVTDEGGGQSGSYQIVLEGVIGEVRPISSSERWKLGQLQQAATHTLMMRYLPQQLPGMIWECEGRQFKVLGFTDVDDMNMFHRVTCEELMPKDR